MGQGFTRQSFSMPLMMLADLKREAAERDMTLNQLIRLYVRNGRLRDTHGGVDLRREDGKNDHGS